MSKFEFTTPEGMGVTVDEDGTYVGFGTDRWDGDWMSLSSREEVDDLIQALTSIRERIMLREDANAYHRRRHEEQRLAYEKARREWKPEQKSELRKIAEEQFGAGSPIVEQVLSFLEPKP